MENGTVTQTEGHDPSAFLGAIIGGNVTVKLNSGVVYKGEDFFGWRLYRFVMERAALSEALFGSPNILDLEP